MLSSGAKLSETDDKPPPPIGGAENYQPICKDPEYYDNIITEWPLDSYLNISQRFYYAHPAIDISARYWTPIRAAGYGFVSKAESQKTGYGNYVQIDHPEGWQTIYAHMIQSPSVKVGEYVFPGKLLGYVGSTGKSTGSHLHFETIYNGCEIDPLTIFNNK